MSQIVDRPMASRYLKHYVCAGCWGRLTSEPVEGRRDVVKIKCWNCGDDRGLVTADFADRQRSEDLARLWDAKQALREVGVEVDEKKPADKILNELGF